jgi:Tol biopolymer transport system component
VFAQGVGVRLVMAVVLVVAALLTASVELAAFPGENGQIALSDDLDDQFSIYVVNPDGSDLRRLTAERVSGGDREPAWSPDGSKIAFSRSLVA